MGTSKNGIIHTYIYSLQLQYVHLQSCTYILDVSKRGVLGSAVDDIVFVCIFCYVLFIMGRSISFHWFFIFLTMVFNSFHCLYGTTESYNATLVERHGFQGKKSCTA